MFFLQENNLSTSIMYIFYSPQTTNFVIFDTNFTPTVQCTVMSLEAKKRCAGAKMRSREHACCEHAWR